MLWVTVLNSVIVRFEAASELLKLLVAFAFFSESSSRRQLKSYGHNLNFPSVSSMVNMLPLTPAATLGHYPPTVHLRSLQCPHCPEQLVDEVSLKCHIGECHDCLLPFKCSQCGKGYQTHTGLMHHVQAHKGKTFMCPVCDTKFTQKFTIKKHLRAIHSSAQCVTCSAVFKIGKDFDHHVINCKSQNWLIIFSTQPGFHGFFFFSCVLPHSECMNYFFL